MWVHFEGGLEGVDRFLGPPRTLQRVPQVDARREELGVQFGGALKHLDRRLQVARRLHDDTHEVEGIDVVRIALQDLFVDLSRLGQITGLMKGEALAKLLGGVHDARPQTGRRAFSAVLKVPSSR